MPKKYIPYLVIFGIVLFDQTLKVWIKTSFYLGEELHIIGDWFRLAFIENYGMAFGWEFGGEFGKLFLSVFRLIAVSFGFYYLHQQIKKNVHKGLLICISMILAGAIGNIIDSTVYGLIFSESTRFHVATFMPEGGGYASFLHGYVVDMLYFPMIDTTFPSWVPFYGDKDLAFFRPVFNLADASITVGVLIIFIFQKNFFEEKTPKKEMQEEEKVEALNL